jgi:hypothetical protein
VDLSFPSINTYATMKQMNQYFGVFSKLKELLNDGNELVSYDKLQERLISTGKFYAGEAVLMIEDMVKSGKIEQTEEYNVYRRRKPDSPN